MICWWYHRHGNNVYGGIKEVEKGHLGGIKESRIRSNVYRIPLGLVYCKILGSPSSCSKACSHGGAFALNLELLEDGVLRKESSGHIPAEVDFALATYNKASKDLKWFPSSFPNYYSRGIL